MRKLNLLKAIVNYVWIMSLICYPLIIILIAILIITNTNVSDLPFKMSGNYLHLDSTIGKIVTVISVLNFGLMLYVLFNFKKLLDNFTKRLIFEVETYTLLSKIGRLIISSSLIYLLAETLNNLSSEVIQVQFGFGPFIYLISLGLFFIVLSEAFLMGKRIKEENELTI